MIDTWMRNLINKWIKWHAFHSERTQFGHLSPLRISPFFAVCMLHFFFPNQKYIYRIISLHLHGDCSKKCEFWFLKNYTICIEHRNNENKKKNDFSWVNLLMVRLKRQIFYKRKHFFWAKLYKFSIIFCSVKKRKNKYSSLLLIDCHCRAWSLFASFSYKKDKRTIKKTRNNGMVSGMSIKW